MSKTDRRRCRRTCLPFGRRAHFNLVSASRLRVSVTTHKHDNSDTCLLSSTHPTHQRASRAKCERAHTAQHRAINVSVDNLSVSSACQIYDTQHNTTQPISRRRPATSCRGYHPHTDPRRVKIKMKLYAFRLEHIVLTAVAQQHTPLISFPRVCARMCACDLIAIARHSQKPPTTNQSPGRTFVGCQLAECTYARVERNRERERGVVL